METRFKRNRLFVWTVDMAQLPEDKEPKEGNGDMGYNTWGDWDPNATWDPSDASRRTNPNANNNNRENAPPPPSPNRGVGVGVNPRENNLWEEIQNASNNSQNPPSLRGRLPNTPPTNERDSFNPPSHFGNWGMDLWPTNDINEMFSKQLVEMGFDKFSFLPPSKITHKTTHLRKKNKIN